MSKIILKPGDKFKYRIPPMVNEYYFLYCGKVDVNGEIKALCHKREKLFPNFSEYKTFPLNHLSKDGKLRHGVTLINQNPVQLEASRRIAKKRKMKWIKEHEKEGT